MRYRAFLSYSHKDRVWGEWLHRRLESYKIDRDLRGRDTPFGPVPSTLQPIFRDRDDFAGGEILADATRRALEASEFLVVICSPNAAASRYVNEEVRTFKAMGRAARVVPIIVDGAPGDPSRECFPAALKFNVSTDGTVTDTPAEIIAADARKEADGRDIAFQKVVAGLLGTGLDEIRKRAARAQHRRVAVLSAVSVVMCALAVGAAIAAWIARERTILAEQRLEWALETAGVVTTKAATFKNKFGVPVPVLTELLGDVEQLLGRLSKEGGTSHNLALREARMLDALSNSNRDLGDTTKALEQSQQAAAKLERVAAAIGATAVTKNDLAWQYMRVGDLLRQRNSLAEAKAKFLSAKEILDSLTRSEPNNPAWQDSTSGVLGRLVDALTLEGDLDAARVAADEDVAIRRRLRNAWPQNTFYASTLALALNRRGTVAQLADNISDAHVSFKEALDLLKPLAVQDPTNSDLAGNLAQSQDNVGFSTERLGNLNEALALYRSSHELYKRISNDDPLNVSKLNAMAKTLDSLGYAYQRTSRLAEASAAYREQIEIRKKIIALDPADATQKSILTISLARLTAAQMESGNTSSALASIEEAIRLGKELDAAGTVTTANKVARIVHLGMLATILDFRGDKARSTSAVEEMVALSDAVFAQDPTSGLKLRGVAIARSMLAVKYREQGRPRDSLEVLNGMLQQAEPQLPRLTQDVGWLNIVSNLHEQVYLSQWDLGDFSAAMDAATRSLDYARQWAEKDTASRDAQQRLANAHTIVANASRRTGKMNEAKVSHNAAIKIRSDLVKADPNNTGFKADLAVSWTRLGDVFSDLRDYPAALDAEQQSIALSQQIIAIDSANANWLITIAWSYSNMGNYLERLGRRAEARAAYQGALSVRETLAKINPENKSWANDIAWTRERVTNLSNMPASTPLAGEKKVTKKKQ
jgi:eukaryotic-like serine/threonine-protein kinase